MAPTWSEQIKMVFSKEFRRQYERKQREIAQKNELKQQKHLDKVLDIESGNKKEKHQTPTNHIKPIHRDQREPKPHFQFREKRLFKLDVPNEMALASYCKEHCFKKHQQLGWQLKNDAPPFLKKIESRIVRSDHIGDQRTVLSKTNELYKVVTDVSLGLHRDLSKNDQRLKDVANKLKKQVHTERNLDRLDNFVSKKQELVNAPPQHSLQRELNQGLQRTR